MQKLIKRVFDFVFALICSVFAIPIILVAMVIIRIKSPEAPTIFKQRRIGYKGKEFTIYKLRTMTDERDENGKVIATASNKADGSVVFPELIYQEVGTYKYTVSEVKGNAENVTYDTSVNAVTVTVTDDGKGSLSAKAEPADVTFNNVFTPKQTPADTPRTGDDSRIALYGVLAILSLMGIVGCAIVGRRHADR